MSIKTMELSGVGTGLLGCAGPRGTSASEFSPFGVSKSSPLRRSIFGPFGATATILPSFVSLLKKNSKHFRM